MPTTLPIARKPPFPCAESNADQRSPIGVTYEGGRNTVTRVFKVLDDDLYRAGTPITIKQAIRYVLGWTEYAGGVDRLFTRHLPVTDPDDVRMVATRCEVRGIANRGNKDDLTLPDNVSPEYGAEFEDYWFSVTFQHVEFDVLDDVAAGS